MTQRNSLSKEEIKKYLFHELPSNEREKIEEQLFEDNDFVYEVLDVENDLIDRYVLEKLEGGELARFEKSLQASPGRREKVATALSLQRCIAEEKQIALAQEKSIAAGPVEISLWKRLTTFISLRSAVPQYGVVGLFILLTVGIVFLLVERRRVNQELAHLRESQSNVEDPLREKALQEQLEAAREREAELNRQIESERGGAIAAHEQSERAVLEREKAERELEKFRGQQSTPTTPQTTIVARFYLKPAIHGVRSDAKEEVLRRNTGSLVITLELEEDIDLKEPLSVEINGRKESADAQLHSLSPVTILASISIAPQKITNGMNTIVLKNADNQEIGNYELNVKKE